jgi:hypothetical protein
VHGNPTQDSIIVQNELDRKHFVKHADKIKGLLDSIKPHDPAIARTLEQARFELSLLKGRAQHPGHVAGDAVEDPNAVLAEYSPSAVTPDSGLPSGTPRTRSAIVNEAADRQMEDARKAKI